jgi:hypothetical protein
MDLLTRLWKIELVTFGKNRCSDAGNSAIRTNKIGNLALFFAVVGCFRRTTHK